MLKALVLGSLQFINERRMWSGAELRVSSESIFGVPELLEDPPVPSDMTAAVGAPETHTQPGAGKMSEVPRHGARAPGRQGTRG